MTFWFWLALRGQVRRLTLLASSHTTQWQHYFALETPLPLGTLGVKCFQPSLDISGKLCVASSCISSSSSLQVSCRTCQRSTRLMILVAPCWMEALWLPTVLDMLTDVPQCCPIIKDLVDVSIGHVLKGLPYLHLTLWLLRTVCCADGFSSSVCQAAAGTTWASVTKVY